MYFIKLRLQYIQFVISKCAEKAGISSNTICLPLDSRTANDLKDKDLVVAGWGFTDVEWGEGSNDKQFI